MILTGDCKVMLRELPDASVDACVTDAPYGLSFMGKHWDYDVPKAETWAEVLRVLKPGAHLLSFFGSRTYHRGVVQIEDAGFEIRDAIMWLYGSGFPKSHNLEGEWEGWGTALKPAYEPIVVARKPLVGTVAENVLAHGTGALNIDGCRVDASDGRPLIESKAEATLHTFGNGLNGSRSAGVTTQGRWPANLIHDGSGEPTDLLGDAARFFYCAKASKSDRGEGNNHPTVKPTDLMRYLCRLVTPPGGVVLDPFMGSGSTGKAALLEGFRFIGCERSPEYVAIARARIDAALRAFTASSAQTNLFNEATT